VFRALQTILYTSNKDEALALLTDFQVDNQHRPKLLQFLDKNYFKQTELQRWMICFRENLNSAGIDTNNYVESWHNALKMYFLKDRQKRRVDVSNELQQTGGSKLRHTLPCAEHKGMQVSSCFLLMIR
ncbi:hypothetical protein BGZ98_003182, partial [Dissophora globulifera]